MSDELSAIAIIVVFLLIIGLVIFGINQEIARNKWLTENCKVIGQISGDTSVGVGIGTNGIVVPVVTTSSGKTGYQCNNGQQY